MLSIKPGVHMDKLQPQIVLGLIAIYSIFERHGYDVTITSISDGNHSLNSLHYVGSAVDLRIKSVGTSDVELLVSDIRRSLGANYDVVLEVDHIHVEYDPK